MYPALSVLLYLKHEAERPRNEAGAVEGQPQASLQPATDLQTLWVGGVGGMEADLVKREGVRFEAIPAAQVHGVGLKALPGLWQVLRGYFASRRLLRKFRPDVLLFTGGYVGVPMALAARRRRGMRSLLYVPDIEPGWALKLLARFADHVAVTVEQGRAFFPKHPAVTVTGYPLRPGLGECSLEEARQVFALRSDLPLLLVFGGSKGARSINQALMAALPELLQEMQVLHISGTLDWPQVEQARAMLTAEQSARYRAYPYLHKEMGAAYRAADLALTRAGASTLGEFPYFGLPSILVPYPYAWRYQRVNAEYLAQRGAAEILEDADLPQQLAPTVLRLMGDAALRAQMGQAMRSLAQPQASAKIADLLVSLAGQTVGERV